MIGDRIRVAFPVVIVWCGHGCAAIYDHGQGIGLPPWLYYKHIIGYMEENNAS